MNRVGIFLAVAACGAFEACAVAFPAAAGGTVTIADPENLEACKNAPKAAFATAATLTGMPALVVPEGVVGAWQVTRSGNTLSFGYNHATAILIR